MALWGNKDSKTATGTVSIADTGVVTGTSTLFTTEAKIGNIITANSVEYVIVTITSNTVAKVIMGRNNGNGTVTTCSAQSYTLSEKPQFVAREASLSSGSGVAGDTSFVYGVDTTEQSAGGDNVTNVAVASGGTQYVEVPSVTFSGGGGSSAAATATIAGGAVTTITVTNTGTGYTSVPTIAVAKARLTVSTTNVDTTTDVITYTAHGLTTGDSILYANGGGASITGLVTATTYFAIVVTANTFKVASSSANATAGTAIDLTGTGNNAQWFTKVGATAATAVASLGSGAGGTILTHAGWVRRTIGTGGRAGRVQQEVLVAMGSMTGDQSDDIQYPDA